MKTKIRLSALLIFLIMMFCSFLFLQVNADAITIVSLAGDKDSFGTGLPLGDPVIPNNMIPDPGNSTFDQALRAPTTWQHQYTLPQGDIIVGAILTVVSIDIEDGGACDGDGPAGCDTLLFLDGLEVIGAFDSTFTPDLSSSGFIPPNTTVFTLEQEFFSLLEDGTVDVVLNPSAGTTRNDKIWLDYAELQIETAPIPEPSTMLLLGSGLAGLGFFRRRRKQVTR